MILSIKNTMENINRLPKGSILYIFLVHHDIFGELSTFIMRIGRIHDVGKAVKLFSSRNGIATIGIKLRRRRNNRVGSKSRNHSRQSKNKKALHKFSPFFR